MYIEIGNKKERMWWKPTMIHRKQIHTQTQNQPMHLILCASNLHIYIYIYIYIYTNPDIKMTLSYPPMNINYMYHVIHFCRIE